MSEPSAESTRWAAKNGRAAEALLPQVYDELRRLAGHQLRNSPPGQTLQPTALVHEAFLRISERQPEDWDGRTLFFAAAARVMRDLIVDRYRERMAKKRGGGMRRVETTDVNDAARNPDCAEEIDLIALDAALQRLEARDKRMAELVNLRYFAGVSMEQAAESLGISLATANREWRLAKAWLRSEIEGS